MGSICDFEQKLLAVGWLKDCVALLVDGIKSFRLPHETCRVFIQPTTEHSLGPSTMLEHRRVEWGTQGDALGRFALSHGVPGAKPNEVCSAAQLSHMAEHGRLLVNCIWQRYSRSWGLEPCSATMQRILLI